VNDTDWIIVGRFGRPHGIKGLITVISFTEPRENILRYAPWYTHAKNTWQPVKLLRVDVTNKSILAQIEDLREREQVALLTNVEIAIRRDQLPTLESGQYYWHQLVGMLVINAQGESLGSVIEIMPTGSNDVLVVEGEKRYLIPYLLEQFILGVDETNRQITVDWDKDF
jgi:16S rRNA processing protein RimM